MAIKDAIKSVCTRFGGDISPKEIVVELAKKDILTTEGHARRVKLEWKRENAHTSQKPKRLETAEA